MRRYIVLLLITGILWAQTDFDILILKDGTTYFGEYSKIEEEIVYFKPQNAFAFQPISIKQVERLELKDGRVAVLDSKAFEEYKKNTGCVNGIFFSLGLIIYSFKDLFIEAFKDEFLP